MKPFKIYWTAYGGWRALFGSRYLYAAFVPFIAFINLWYYPNSEGVRIWPTYALAILPALISFSLGSLAIVFAMSSGTYVKLLHKGGASDSMFMQLVAVFFHFLLVQGLALFAALGAITRDSSLTSGIAFWLFCYALMCGVAAAANLVMVADIKNRASPLDDDAGKCRYPDKDAQLGTKDP